MALEFKSDVIDVNQARRAIANSASLVADPNTWTRGGALCRDKDGGRVAVDAEEAVSFCIIGAIMRSVQVDDFLGFTNDADTKQQQKRHIAARDIEKYFEKHVGTSLAEFNDNSAHSHSDVVLLFKSILRDLH